MSIYEHMKQGAPGVDSDTRQMLPNPAENLPEVKAAQTQLIENEGDFDAPFTEVVIAFLIIAYLIQNLSQQLQTVMRVKT